VWSERDALHGEQDRGNTWVTRGGSREVGVMRRPPSHLLLPPLYLTDRLLRHHEIFSQSVPLFLSFVLPPLGMNVCVEHLFWRKSSFPSSFFFFWSCRRHGNPAALFPFAETIGVSGGVCACACRLLASSCQSWRHFRRVWNHGSALYGHGGGFMTAAALPGDKQGRLFCVFFPLRRGRGLLSPLSVPHRSKASLPQRDSRGDGSLGQGCPS